MKPAFTLCICTMNRPDTLRECLAAAARCTVAPDQILVSDDSADGAPTQAVVAEFPNVQYIAGPRRGLGANRNACLRRAAGTHITFMDDDVVIAANFFQTAQDLVADAPAKQIITGIEWNHANGGCERVVPKNVDFWGFQKVPALDEYRSIVINSTVFPRSLFETIAFDEKLRYGCEEIDIARHAVALGYQIVMRDQLSVHHYPSPVNRGVYSRFADASRLYSTAKALWLYEKRPLRAIVYSVLAPPKELVFHVRKRGIAGFTHVVYSTALALQYGWAAFRARASDTRGGACAACGGAGV